MALFLAAQPGGEIVGEIVNCDSLQVYRGFDIGTAKEIPRGVPHHLFDILDPTEVFTAGDYARRAAPVLEEIAARGKTPILTGGTGLYLRALIDGLSPAPLRNEALRARLEKRSATHLHRLLTRLDRATALRIHPNDKPKTIRAVEVCVEARQPMSRVIAEDRQRLTGFDVVKLVLNPPRAGLYERINLRAVRMFERGLIEEVRGLLAAGVPRTAKPFDAPGYTEALAVIEGAMTVADAIDLTQRRTRHYAKRQTTWFRGDNGVHWLPGFGDDPEIRRAAQEFVLV